jgi:hypothetical protein
LFYLQVVIPEDPPFELEYHTLREHLHNKYRRELPEEFTKVGGGDYTEGANDREPAFTPASCTTEADKKNDVRSLQRALDRRLFFLVKSRGIHILRPGSTECLPSGCLPPCHPCPTLTLTPWKLLCVRGKQ